MNRKNLHTVPIQFVSRRLVGHFRDFRQMNGRIFFSMANFFSDGDANGDISGDDQSADSDHPDQNDDNSLDSERGGALNLVSSCFSN